MVEWKIIDNEKSKRKYFEMKVKMKFKNLEKFYQNEKMEKMEKKIIFYHSRRLSLRFLK